MVRSETQTDADEQIESLIRSREDDDWEVRRDAVRKLGEIDDERVIEPLTEARRDDNADVRAEALDALRIIDDRRVVEPLIKALKNRSVRDYAIPLFKKIGGIRAIKSLIKSIDSTDEGVRWHTTPELVKIGKPVVASLIKALKHRSKDVRTYAARVICAMEDPKTVDHLIGVLKYKNMQGIIIPTLCKIGDERVVELLIGLLERRDEWRSGEWRNWQEYGGDMYGYYPAEEYSIPLALGRIGDPRAVEPLIKAFDECRYGDDVAGGSIAYALGEIGDQRAVEPLIKTLKHPNAYTRRKAATALGMIGDPRAIEPLISALGDHRSRDVWYAAMDALVKIGEPAGKVLIKASTYPDDALSERFKAFVEPIGRNRLDNRGGHMHRYIEDTLSKLIKKSEAVESWVKACRYRDGLILLAENGRLTVKELTEELENDNWVVRWGAVVALGKIDGMIAIEPLISALDDEDIRDTVIPILCKINDVRIVEPLIETLESGEWQDFYDVFRHERKYIVPMALGRIGDPRAVEPLIEAMTKQLGGVYRWNVINALVTIGEPSVKPLINALGDVCDKSSAYSLDDTGEPVIKRLVDKLRRTGRFGLVYGDDACASIRTVLDWIGEPAVEPLMEALKDENVVVRAEAAGVLGMIGDPRAVEPLINTLGDEDARLHAAVSLGKIGESAVTSLIGVVSDEDVIVRALTAHALGEIGDPRAVDPLRQLLDDSDESVRDIAAHALEAIDQTTRDGR